jgi:hypothetical protein
MRRASRGCPERARLHRDRMREGELRQALSPVPAAMAAVTASAEGQARILGEDQCVVHAGHPDPQAAGDLDAVVSAEDCATQPAGPPVDDVDRPGSVANGHDRECWPEGLLRRSQ